MILTADRVVPPARTFPPGWVEVVGDRVADGGPGLPPRDADLALGPVTVVPGFVDAHVHGGGGRACTDATEHAVATVTGARLARGTSTMMARLVTDTLEALEAPLKVLAPLVHDG